MALQLRLARALEVRTVFLGVVLAALSRQFIQPVIDTDFWWHLEDGRWIVEHRALPGHDLYTFTVPDHAWLLHEWLSEVVMYGLWAAGGQTLVSVFFGLLTLGGFVLIWRTAELRAGGNLPFVVVGLGLVAGALAGAELWTPRFQIWTFFFSCLVLYWLEGWISGRSRALWWFIPISALWANLHGSYLVGIAFLGIGLVALVVAGGLRLDPLAWQLARGLAAILALSVLAAALNPYGVSIYAYSVATTLAPGIQNFITEWQSPNFHDFANRPFEILLLLTLAGFALRRPRLHEVLLVIFTLALALQAVRHVALFVAAATPVAIRCYTAAWTEWSERLGWRLRAPTRSAALAAVGGLALVAVMGRIALDLSSQPAIDRGLFPVGAASWLAAHPDTGGAQPRMFNKYYWGGYLIYRFYPDPRRRVFIFGESFLVGGQVIADYADIEFTSGDWQRLLDQYGVNYVVDNAGGPLDQHLRAPGSGWAEVYRDAQAVIYVRSSEI